MTEKKRPPRFDDIAALSHQPPPRRATVSPFARAHDAEEEERKRAGVNRRIDAKPMVDANTPAVDVSLGVNAQQFGAKTSSLPLAPDTGLASTTGLASVPRLTPKKKNPPSWRMSRVTIRLDKEKLERLQFVVMSRGITLQDLFGGWADAFLADEGLTPTQHLASTAGWRPTDQMIDDVGSISTSSIVVERPEELLRYYAKWTDNTIRESDWQAMRLALSYSALAIKAGILMSILRTKSRVNSFKYCLGAIDEVAKAGVVNSADYVRYLEAKVEKGREGKQLGHGSAGERH